MDTLIALTLLEAPQTNERTSSRLSFLLPTTLRARSRETLWLVQWQEACFQAIAGSIFFNCIRACVVHQHWGRVSGSKGAWAFADILTSSTNNIRRTLVASIISKGGGCFIVRASRLVAEVTTVFTEMYANQF